MVMAFWKMCSLYFSNFCVNYITGTHIKSILIVPDDDVNWTIPTDFVGCSACVNFTNMAIEQSVNSGN
jgi:hypothetical protein